MPYRGRPMTRMKGRQVGERLSEDVIRLIRIASDVAARRYGTKALSTRLLVSIAHTLTWSRCSTDGGRIFDS